MTLSFAIEAELNKIFFPFKLGETPSYLTRNDKKYWIFDLLFLDSRKTNNGRVLNISAGEVYVLNNHLEI